MRKRRLSCAIEQIEDWHSNLFLEPYVVAFVAVANQYSSSRAVFDVACTGLKSRWLGESTSFWLEVEWHNDTAHKAERMRATMQPRPLLEFAAVAIAFILTRRVVPLGKLEVAEYGTRADYFARRRKVVLEVSGTETASELTRRHREKVLQAMDNPFGWNAFVVVCAFSRSGHEVQFSRQEAVR